MEGGIILPFRMRLDAHVHLSTYQGNADSLEGALDALLADMAANGIGAAIVIPDNVEGSETIADLDRAMALIGDRTNLHVLGSPQILQRGSGECDRYRKLLETGAIKGLKFFPGHDAYYPTDERCLPYYAICEELGTPVLFHTGQNTGDSACAEWNDPKYIVDIAKRYPALPVVITHYFWPKMEYCYEITRDCPNICFETAAMADGEVVEMSGGIGTVRGILKQTIADRPDKVMFGTDWPMCDMADHIRLVTSLGLPSDIEEAVFSGNARRIYRLG